MIEVYNDEFFMKQALLEAKKAFDKDEVPVGAVVVLKNRIIARGHNLTEQLSDVTAHAEVQAITSAAQFLGSKYLKGCTMYVSLEPCVMCAGALYWAKIKRVVVGALDPERGFLKAAVSLHPKTSFSAGVLEDESKALLNQFFSQKRI